MESKKCRSKPCRMLLNVTHKNTQTGGRTRHKRMPKKKQGETAPPAAAGPASPSSPPTPASPKAKDEKEVPVYEWATLKLKVVGWSHTDSEVTLPTSMTIQELRYLLEERHGWFLDLAVALDAAPGHAGHTMLLDTSAAASLQPAPSTTLAECGVWGRRHRCRVDAEGADTPVVRFVYYAFTHSPGDPLLLYNAGP